MAYDTSSTHPYANLIRQVDEGDVPAAVVTEQLERLYYTDSADLSGINLANTLEVVVVSGGVRTAYVFDAGETNTGTGIIRDAASRTFVAVELTMTQAAYEALAYKPPNTKFNITET